MPLIITLESGRQHVIKGESWKAFDDKARLGATVGETLAGHPLLINKNHIATLEEIKDAEWNAEIEAAAKVEKAKAEAEAMLNRVREYRAARKPLARLRRLFGRKR